VALCDTISVYNSFAGLVAYFVPSTAAMEDKDGEDDVVDLNVGGSFYSTTRTTLLRYDSMLSRMFSGRHELKRRPDGRIFIDRDGELFKFVLQFLRDGDLDVASLDSGLQARLKRSRLPLPFRTGEQTPAGTLTRKCLPVGAPAEL
jgi:hypothetical protein